MYFSHSAASGSLENMVGRGVGMGLFASLVMSSVRAEDAGYDHLLKLMKHHNELLLSLNPSRKLSKNSTF
ncbi:MAG: hypothetical protein O2779_03820 [Nanoarchaeota archaeon]|nr:hypothetical protein [Nanoarchaeota archaeon]